MKTSLREKIKQTLPAMRPSEQKVAQFVLSEPSAVIKMRIVDLASRVNISEPTVVRFCKAIQCDGFQSFKLLLAQELGETPSLGSFALSPTDTPTDFSYKVFDSTIDALKQARNNIDHLQLEKAILALSLARRVEFYGFGASGVVASDAQHKFFRLQMVTAAYSDPHLQNMSAVSLSPNDVVVAISQSGKTKDLLSALSLVKETGATIVSISPHGSPVSNISDISLDVFVEEQFDYYSPLPSRITHMVIIDVLAVGVSQHKGEDVIQHLEKINRALKSLREENKNC